MISTRYNFLLPDVDECATPEANECDLNAMCTNTEGSYVCRCRRGYAGDGRNCTGKYFLSFDLFHWLSQNFRSRRVLCFVSFNLPAVTSCSPTCSKCFCLCLHLNRFKGKYQMMDKPCSHITVFSSLFMKTLTSVIMLSQTSATPVLCAPIPKGLSSAAAWWDMKETEGLV